ncbi:uncharacterized protein BYT42DRAFT_550235 [Radiomyces spectabilis]|uniref:uncharacterized protein n=1 Tax=Radiomyces spectabilis TaxID=64574 RepID=UPI00221F66D0|nr:uncharacterized protein BYT42DRAFT_550235 [Radiomyces spectabilis]KAI8365378.1 hypothetical protein BYT42DRAFT_550235 [Radiomyces spectabilis]
MRYWIIGLCYFIGWWAATAAVDVIVINQPTPNQKVVNRQVLAIQYTIIGAQTINPPINALYPSSMDATFHWQQRQTPSTSFNISGLSNLNTDPYPAGIQNQIYTAHWKLPNCHFFARYKPTDWDFTLVFELKYPINPNNLPTQPPIRIPLAIEPVGNDITPKCT